MSFFELHFPPAESTVERPRGQEVSGLGFRVAKVLLMIKILHHLKDPKLWELWDIPHYG